MNDYFDEFLNSFERFAQEGANFVGLKPLPSSLCVENCANEIIDLMFPGRCNNGANQTLKEIVTHQFQSLKRTLTNLIYLSYCHQYEEQDCPSQQKRNDTNKAIEILFKALPEIRYTIKKDVQAGFRNDPAATDIHDIILSYPFVKAITIHRVAHVLYNIKVPLLPRMLSEWAHSKTGIDIHPGAKIGESFFIDHGTGVVIGETSIIGNNVKLYQGVTLGAISFQKDDMGNLIKGIKRHPTIKNNVTIYSNATILGDITVGENCVIGSSSWIKEDIDPNTLVVISNPEIIHKKIKK